MQREDDNVTAAGDIGWAAEHGSVVVGRGEIGLRVFRVLAAFVVSGEVDVVVREPVAVGRMADGRGRAID